MKNRDFTRREFLRICGIGAAASSLGCGSLTDTKAPASRRPNIIFILADDLGWAELGCYGNDFNETPNLDRMAKEGMRFTNAYASAPVCSPYRAAFLTGQYPARVGITDYLRPGDKPLSTDHVTIAKLLKRNGYATCMIGKWHLTGYRHHGAKVEIRPTDHGFDEELINEIKGVGNGANFFPYVFRTQKICWLNVKKKRLPGNEYLVDRMNLEAVDFIERNKDRPFFLYLSHFATHSILNGKPEVVEKYRRKHAPPASKRTRCYLCKDAGKTGDADNHWAPNYNPHLAAMLESIDDGVGMIVKKLSELGLADNTLIVFTSDNGGESQVTLNGALRAGKSSLYEGGIRVPLVIRWPGKTGDGGVCDGVTTNVDFYPTFASAAGAATDPKQHLDGVSITPMLIDPKSPVKRNDVYWHYPLDKPHFLGGVSSGAVRHGRWKLIEFFETGKLELYDLQIDLGEQTDLSARHPERVAEMRRRLSRWRKGIGARIPNGQKVKA
ncbi:MAG: sulfatase [Phycisphaerae bacterium]|jgi:arylsulfatase A-like enzyme|nr:sulfatase [Phycisphaerae bacterium]